MEFARAAETKPFAWCIREGRSRVARNRDTPGFHRVYSYVERGLYGEQVRRALQLFDRRQILVLRSEDLREQPDRTVREVCRFIGAAEPAGPVLHRTVYAASPGDYNSTLTADDVTYLRALYRPDLEAFQEATSIDVSDWISGADMLGS
jgi:hypothetical protein